LIETATEADLWSETYDSTVSDWLSVQADVASDVAQSVVKELAPHPMSVSSFSHPGIFEAVRRLGECADAFAVPQRR
jgi:hypothetical protein